MYRLVTFGGLGLAKDGEPLAKTSIQRRQLALLALLAAGGRAGVSRDKLVGYLWPEREPERARNLLDQALSAARRALGHDVFVAQTATLALNPEILGSDVADFESLRESEPERAVAVYAGPFLDGVFVADAPEFERWVDAERSRFARELATVLETLAMSAESRADARGASIWWRRLAETEPLSAHAATGLMRALALSGDRAGALEFARVHEALVRQELEADPDPSVTSLAERIRNGDALAPMVATMALATLPSGDAMTLSADPRAVVPHPLAQLAPVAPARPHRRRLVAFAAVAALAVTALTVRRALSADSESVAVTRRSIAVLAFRNIAAESGNEYFSDGFTEELITALSQVPGLRVAARTSSFAAGARTADAREIGKALDVTTLLAGSVQKTGSRLRVTAQLVDTRNGFHVWTGKFDRDYTDVFAVEDEIAQQIVASLRPALGDSTRAPRGSRRTRDLDAYALYLQGRFAWRQRSAESLQRAVEFFQAALAKDSGYADAYAGLGDVYAVLPLYSRIPADTAYARAEGAARHALELQPAMAEPYATLALMSARRYRWAQADSAFRRALAIDPNYSTAHQWHGKMLGTSGRLSEGEAALRRALVLDPLVPVIHYNLGQNLFWQKRNAEARAAFERALSLDATFYPARTYLGFIAADEGRTKEAVAEFRRVLDSRSSDDDRAILAYGLARAGERDSASAILTQLVPRGMRELVSPADIALGFLGVGDASAAFHWLDVAATRHDSDLEAFVRSPLLEPLRRDPRWGALTAKMGLR